MRKYLRALPSHDYLFVAFLIALVISIGLISSNVSNVRDPRPQAYGIRLNMAPRNSSNKTAGSQGNCTAAVNELAWQNPNNVVGTSDYTHVTTTTSNNQCTNFIWALHDRTGNVPSNATIRGIEVEVTRQALNSTGSTDSTIQLIKNNQLVGNSKSGGSIPVGVYQKLTVGSKTDLWGTTWTPSDVDALNFGAAYQAFVGPHEEIRISRFRIKVTYDVPDNTPPIVTIDSPANGSNVANTVTFKASASDNWNISSIVLKIDGSSEKTCSYATSCSFSWDTTGYSNGQHTLAATATDYDDNTAGQAYTVTVDNGAAPDTTKPSVSITSPSNGSTVTGTKTFSASASDASGIASIVLRIGSKNKKTCNNTTSCSYSWNTTNSSNGSYSLRATATDNASNSNFDTHIVTVSNNSGTPDPDPDPDPEPPPPIPPPPGGGLPTLPPAPPGIPGVAVPIDPDIVNILKVNLSVPFLLGNIKSPLIVGGFVQDLELKPGQTDYEVDVRGAKFALGKTLNIQIGGNKALIKKLKIKTKAPKQPVKFGTLYLGDTNRDNKINDEDFQRYLDSIATQDESSDVNADRVVNSLDWAILLVNFGKNGSR